MNWFGFPVHFELRNAGYNIQRVFVRPCFLSFLALNILNDFKIRIFKSRRENIHHVITCITQDVFVSFTNILPPFSVLMDMFAILCADSSRQRKTLLIYCSDRNGRLSPEQTLNKTPLKTLVYQQTLPWFISSKAKFIKVDIWGQLGKYLSVYFNHSLLIIIP